MCHHLHNEIITDEKTTIVSRARDRCQNHPDHLGRSHSQRKIRDQHHPTRVAISFHLFVKEKRIESGYNFLDGCRINYPRHRGAYLICKRKFNRTLETTRKCMAVPRYFGHTHAYLPFLDNFINRYAANFRLTLHKNPHKLCPIVCV